MIPKSNVCWPCFSNVYNCISYLVFFNAFVVFHTDHVTLQSNQCKTATRTKMTVKTFHICRAFNSWEEEGCVAQRRTPRLCLPLGWNHHEDHRHSSVSDCWFGWADRSNGNGAHRTWTKKNPAIFATVLVEKISKELYYTGICVLPVVWLTETAVGAHWILAKDLKSAVIVHGVEVAQCSFWLCPR